MALADFLEAYRRAEYWIGASPHRLCLRIGQTADGLRSLIQFVDPEFVVTPETPWAYITAWNPGSTRLSETENRVRHAALEKGLRNECAFLLPGVACDPEKLWPDEEGVFTAILELKRALYWGRKFGQNAVVAGSGEGKVELLFCAEQPG